MRASPATEDPVKILFVCMGNICRSPTAEGMFRRMLAEQDPPLPVEVDSAGTHGYHVGAPPDRRAVAAGRARGLDLSGLRARRLQPDDFERFDLILAMDQDNLAELESIAPETRRARTGLLLDYAPDVAQREVPDPYYGGVNGFEQVLDLVESACAGLLADIRHRLDLTPVDESS